VTDLLALTAELVAIPSVSGDETALADRVEAELRASAWLEVVRVGDNLVARSPGRGRRVVLAGHLDTVPANGNCIPRVAGDTLWGLGSADMKGGLAVMLALAAEAEAPPLPVTFAFYVAEEIAREHNGLLQIEAADPDLLAGDVAILGEPTGAVVEAGCQGSLSVEVTVGGARAHTARPWRGINALHRLGPLLDRVACWQERRPVIDGCEYREALQAVRAEAGVASNVVPDSATLTLNHRFSPDRDAEQALAALLGYLTPVLDPEAGDSTALLGAAPGALPGLGEPLLAALVDVTGAAPRAKLGWTDVAFFSERGIPAANFGPGDPEVAHTADEAVTRADLDAAHRSLRAVLHQSR
jgi:succinyl-diaminopimelate desuccinylase